MRYLALGVSLCIVLALSSATTAQTTPCAGCEFFTGYIIESLGSDTSPAHVERVMNSFCDHLPSFLQPSCRNWVRQNRIQVSLLLSGGATANQICRRTGACSSTNVVSVSLSRPTPQNEADCDVCIFTIWQVQRELKNNFTAENIALVLNQVCASLPLFQSECFNWVKNDLPQLVKYLMDRDSAQQICKYLQACGNSTAMSVETRHTLQVARLGAATLAASGTSGGCQLCQWVISAFEAWLSDDHTQAEITNFLQQVCPFFNEYASQCQQLVEVYTPKLIENLIQSATPPVVCTQFGVCPAS